MVPGSLLIMKPKCFSWVSNNKENRHYDRIPLILKVSENHFSQCCCCSVTTLKMARKPVKLQKENPAGCAGDGKQSNRPVTEGGCGGYAGILGLLTFFASSRPLFYN